MSNFIQITGNIGRDLELRTTSKGQSVVSFSVADTPYRKNESGEWVAQADTLWVEVTFWGDEAVALADSGLGKGSKVMVTGRLACDSFQRTDGTTGSKLRLLNPEVAQILTKRGQDGTKNSSGYTGTAEPSSVDSRGNSVTNSSGSVNAAPTGANYDPWQNKGSSSVPDGMPF